MGSGAKVALVAILILMVVAVAQFVQRGKDDEGGQPGAAGAKAAQEQSGGAKKESGPRLAAPRAPASAGSPGLISNRKSSPPLALGSPGQKPADAPGAVPGSTGSIGTAAPAPHSIASAEAASRPREPAPSSPGPLAPGPAVPPIQSSAGSAPLVAAAPGSAPTSSSPGAVSPSTVGGTLAPARGELQLVQGTGASAPAPKTNLDPSPRPAGKTLDEPLTAPTRFAGPDPVESPGKAVSKSFEGGSTGGSKPSRADDAGKFPLSHQVEPGDSYWRIAERYYGHGRGKLHTVIAAANGGAKLIAGKTIQVPAPPPETAAPVETVKQDGKTDGAKPEKAKPARAAGGVISSDARYDYYAVQKGDTLSSLARRFYGNATRIKPIEDANPNLRYETLREGVRIRIPKEKEQP